MIAGLTGVPFDASLATHLDAIVNALESMTPTADFEARLDDLESLYPASVPSAGDRTQLGAELQTLKESETEILNELRELGARV